MHAHLKPLNVVHTLVCMRTSTPPRHVAPRGRRPECADGPPDGPPDLQLEWYPRVATKLSQRQGTCYHIVMQAPSLGCLNHWGCKLHAHGVDMLAHAHMSGHVDHSLIASAILGLHACGWGCGVQRKRDNLLVDLPGTRQPFVCLLPKSTATKSFLARCIVLSSQMPRL